MLLHSILEAPFKLFSKYNPLKKELLLTISKPLVNAQTTTP